MNRTRKALCLAVVLASLGAGTAVAQEPPDNGVVRMGRRHWMVTGGSNFQTQLNDPRHIEGYQTAYYYECSDDMPPACWLVSKLNFWVMIDLGYRKHAFRGRTTVSLGSGIPWSAWTAKRHRMTCVMGARTCGLPRAVPTGQAYSAVKFYKTTRFPNPGRFRFRSSACATGNFVACGVGRTMTPPIRCNHADDYCYFDVGWPRDPLNNSPLLGLATTEELFRELLARFGIDGAIGSTETRGASTQRALVLAEMLGGLDARTREYRTIDHG